MRKNVSQFALLAAAIVVGALAGRSALAANLLTNGSFEQPVVTPPAMNFTGAFSFTGWSGSSPGSGGNAGLVSGTNISLSPKDGQQDFSFNGNNPPAGTYIEQTFTTVPGQLYEVDFAIGCNGQGNSDLALSLNAQAFDTGNTQLSSLSAAPPAAVGWSTKSFNFTADSASTRLRFTDTSTSNPSEDVFIDAVSVSAVPEPASLALLGAGAIGLLLRRKRAS